MRHDKSQIWSWQKPHIRRSRDREVVRRSRRVRPELTLMEPRALLSTFTVRSTADDGSEGTLRWAIQQANSDDQSNTIDFSPAVFATPQTITLTQRQLALSDATGAQTIVGPAAGVTVAANGKSRVFEIEPNVTATISGVTITGGGGDADRGGGVLVLQGSRLTMTDDSIADNSASGDGGGIDNLGIATLINDTIAGNSASQFGAGIENAGTLSLTDDTIADNSGSMTGGGVDNRGTLTLTADSLTGNSSRFGGGIQDVNASLTIENVTISGNRAADGAGLDISGGTSQIDDATISGNAASVSGGGLRQENAGSTTMINTIVAGNVAASKPDDIVVVSRGRLSGSHNLIGTGGSGGLRNGVDGNLVDVAHPGLAPLGNYGGPTQTVALESGSPAIGMGAVVGQLNTDERGFARRAGVDIGAFQTESGPLVVNTTAGGGQSLVGQLSLPQAVNLANVSSRGASITFDPAVFAAHQTITLTNGQLALSDTHGMQTIIGPAARVTVSAGGRSRVLEIEPKVSADISGMTITSGGHVDHGAGVLALDGSNLALRSCTREDNSVDEEAFTYRAEGGGLLNQGGTVDVLDCTINGNTAYAGGGIENEEGVTGHGSLTLTNDTLTQNRASLGGGLFNFFSDLTLINDTVSDNSAAKLDTGGVYNASNDATVMTNTIVAGNFSDLSTGDILSTGPLTASHNLVGTDRRGALKNGVNGNIGGVDNPGLAPLGNYGGPTQTMALLPGSPAIDAGDVGPDIPATDQRGEPRVGAPDIGAFESQGITLTIVPGASPQQTTIGTPFVLTNTASAAAQDTLQPSSAGLAQVSANVVDQGTR